MLAKAFGGTTRYEIVRRLGAGASGIVYEARDRERQERVALKTLTELDAAALFRFKREFRALTDVVHRNLVRLHELVAEGDEWFFTMELVEGTELLEHVWARPVPPDASTTAPAHSHTRARPSGAPRSSSAPPSDFAGPDYTRLRAALVQLVSALEALHAAGKLHRDIKPSNVLVARDGRVVVVDFGIAKDLREKDGEMTDEGAVIGTPLYMAPEQAFGQQELTPAADWYAVGALLYMAITGRPPLEGDVLTVLMDKQRKIPDPPSAFIAGVPEDLDALCMSLLQIDPAARPSGAAILQRLGGAPLASSAPRDSLSSGKLRAARAPFVGRADVLASLRTAFDAMVRGSSTIALVQGVSGMGKSATLRHFLDGLGDGAVVLNGRCFERESVPYKAFDSVIDALTQHLLALKTSDQAALMPRDVAALARIFPVLDRVPTVADAPRQSTEGADAQQVRRKAFVALRDLLARLGDRHPLVVFVDDLQWGDADSAALLRELTVQPDPPRMLLVLAFRSEDVLPGSTLATLIDPEHGLPAGRETVSIDVGALSPSDARGLTADLLGDGAQAGFVDRIVSEAAGSPFFIGELVHYVRSVPSASEVRLDGVLRARLHTLDAGALRLLQMTAIAGRPIAQEIAFRAAGLMGDERSSALSALRMASLVRAQGTRAEDRVESFHDRIREAAVASIEPESLRVRHAELARALVESGHADPEALFMHSHAAGMDERACDHAVAAAKKASLALAFDRAAQFYRLALDLMPDDDARKRRLRVELGDALANGGRGAEAAEQYLASTEHASAADRLALQRRAAEELLFSGHINQGMDVIADVLAHFGKRFARKRWQALVTLIVLRLWLMVRGLKFEVRDASTIAATELIKLDVYLSASLGLSVVDNIIAAPFSTRNVLACLEVGEPWCICRAVCQELLLVASEGRPATKKVERYLTMARGLAERVKRPDSSALVLAATGLASHFRGEWARAYEGMSGALGIYQDEAQRATAGIRELVGQNYTIRWEVDTFRYFSLAALVQLGKIDEVEEKLTAYLRDAKERGDLYIQTNLQIGDTNLWWLARDTPDAAAAVVSEAMQRWSKRSFQMQHWWELQALAQADLYSGRPAEALARLRERWAPLRGSLLMRVQYLRLRALHLRGRAALALAGEGRDAGALLASAESDAKRILRERVPWADAMAELLLAGVRRQRGDDAGARAILERAERGLEAADMGLWALVARRRHGELQGGEGGKAMAERADEGMRARAIRAPERMVAMFAPGFVIPSRTRP